MIKYFHFKMPAACLLALASLGVAAEPTAVSVAVPQGTVRVTPLNDNIFHVDLIRPGESREGYRSQTCRLAPQPNGVRVEETPAAIELISPTTRVAVDRNSGKVSFLDRDGRPLLSEAGGIGDKSVALVPAGGDTFYGAGERGHSLRLNGDSLVMYNRQNYGYTATDPRISQMNITMPWVVSDKGYGVFFDDYAKAAMQLGDTITYTTSSRKPLSYYFVNGNGTLAGAVEQYTLLTGRQQLPPLWTLGYITSKYGYHTQDETLGVVDTLKTRGYPLDGIVLDLYWYGKETDMGRLEWNKRQWPDHRKMLADLKAQGVNTVLISQPYINKIGAIDNYNMLASEGMLVRDSAGNVKDVTTWVGDAGMFDVSNPKTREWLWNRYKTLTDDGVAGWWGDLGEPEVHPLGMVHANGETTEEYHNAYGNEWSRIIHEGFRRDFPDRRVMMLMRGGTAGLQRYNVFPWSTDVSRSWGGFRPQVNIMLNSGLSGLGYMSSDVGGFAVDPEHPVDPELYVRWLQQGVFSPTLRTHAQDRPEPYHYPEMEEISKRFIRMRYEWLPYNYTLAYENATRGLPFARPLDFRGGDGSGASKTLADEYLWGDNVLVAPVMEQGARSREVWFPAGEWYSFLRPASGIIRGGRSLRVDAPLDELPLFVRAGAFIPLCMQPIENTAQYDPQLLTVRYFPSAEKTTYTLFDDNRLSPTSIEDGQYRLTTFTGRRTAKETEISLEGNGGSYASAPEVQMMTLEIEDVDARPRKVSVEGVAGVGRLAEAASPKAIRQYGWSYDAASRRLTVKFAWNFGRISLKIK